MFSSALRIKNALLSLFLSIALLAVAVQPVYAAGKGNAYAYGKAKHAAVSTDASTSTATTTQGSQKPATTPGDNGDIKTHNLTTPTNDQRDEPKVCGFYLDAFNFDAREDVSWKIVKHTHGDTVLTGDIVLANGYGRTADLSLPNGMYKVYWNFEGEHGSAKHKVFKVDCDVTPTTPNVVNHKNPLVNVKSNTCVVAGQNSGSLTVSVTNVNTKTSTYKVEVGNSSQEVTVAPGKSETVQFTDLAAGNHTVVVTEKGCVKTTVKVKVDECPVVPVGRGSGVVLSDNTTTPTGVLADTGEMPLMGSLIALVLAVVAGLTFVKRPESKFSDIDSICL
jgi:uncharacterized protein (AIM24 family)